MAVKDVPELTGTETITVTYTHWGEYRYFASFAMSFGYRGQPTLNDDLTVKRVWADGSVIFDADSGWAWPGVRFHFRPGTEDQLPVEDAELAYRGHILLWFTDFPCSDFGDRIPTISVEFVEGDGFTLAQAMETFAVRAGYDLDDITTTRMGDTAITGYIVGSRGTLENIAADMGLLYNFTTVEVTGKIIFARQYDGETLVIDDELDQDTLAVLAEGQTEQQIFAMERQDDNNLPRLISATYFDIDASYEPGTQTVQRHNAPVRTQFSDREASMTLPVVMTGAEMRSRLYETLYKAWINKNACTIRLPSVYTKNDPGEVFSIVVYDMTFSGLITRQSINADNSVTMSLVEIAAEYHAVAAETQPPARREPIVSAYPVRAVLIDVPDTKPEDTDPDALNLWAALGGLEPEQWRGARLDMTTATNPNEWAARLATPEETGISELVEPPAGGTLRVALNNTPAGRFEAATEGELDDGETNLLAVGREGRFELLQFGTVTVDGVNLVLGALRRGLYGTENNVDMLTIGDWVIFLADTVKFTYPGEDYTNSVRYLYRAVGVGRNDMANVDVNMLVPLGNSRKPMAPINVIAAQDESDNIVFSWDRRARYFPTPEDGLGQPLDETLERYSVDIYDLDWTRVIRRSDDLETPEYVYSTADQEADGTAGLSSQNVLVYQLSDTAVRRGYPGGGIINVKVVPTLAGRIGGGNFTGELYAPTEHELTGRIGGGSFYGLLRVPKVRELSGSIGGGNFTGKLFAETSEKLLSGRIGGGNLTGNVIFTPPPEIQIVDHRTTAQTAVASSITIDVPPHVNGDLLIMRVAKGVSSNDVPSGWTLIRGQTSGNYANMSFLAYRIASSEPANYTVNKESPTNYRSIGTILRVVGFNPSAPIAGSSLNLIGNTTSPIAPSVNPAMAGSLFIGTISSNWHDAGQDSYTAFGGQAQYGQWNTNGGGTNGCIAGIASEKLSSSGASGNRTWTSARSVHAFGISVAIAPGDGGTLLGANDPEYISMETGSESGTTITIDKPTGLSIDDMMVAYIAGGTEAQTGWSKVHDFVYTRIATADDVAASDFTFTFTGSESREGAILCIRDGKAVISHARRVVGHSSTNNALLNTVAATRAGQLMVAFAVAPTGGSDVAFSPPSGMTERLDGNNISAATMVTTGAGFIPPSGFMGFGLSASLFWQTSSLIIEG